MEREFKTYFKSDIPHKKKWSEKTPAERQKEWNEKRSKSLQKSLEKKKPQKDLLELWFKAIHKKYSGICQESGVTLCYDKKHCCHLLPKKDGAGGYSYFKNYLNNGILLAWKYHSILDSGTAKQRLELKCWSTIRKMRTKLLESVGLPYDENYWLNMCV